MGQVTNLNDTYPFPVILDAVIVWYKHLEDLIKDTYGEEISIPESYESNNGSYINIDLSEATPDGWNLEGINADIQGWLNSVFQWVDLESIMADLVFKGILPAKNYTIHIWW